MSGRWLWAMALVVAACGGEEQPGVAPAVASRSARTVLIVSVDGLGGDAFDATQLPALAELQRESIDFRQHVIASTALNPELASLMTGRYPTEHGLGSIHDRGLAGLANEERTLAEAAQAAGWRSLAAVGARQLDAGLSGLAQGFDSYHSPAITQRAGWPAQQVLQVAQSELEGLLAGEDPVLLWYSFGDVAQVDRNDPGELGVRHLREYLAPFRKDQSPLDAALDGLDGGAESYSLLVQLLSRRRGSAEYLAWRQALHMAGLERVDHALGQLRESLVASGRAQAALVVVLGARGALIEPPAGSGGPAFKPEVVRTRLLLRLPGGAGAGKSERLCSSVDVASSLAAAFDWELPEAQGQDLFGDGADEPSAVFCEGTSYLLRAAFSALLHVEENAVRGMAPYNREGQVLLRESELEPEVQERLAGLRESLGGFAQHWGFSLEREIGPGGALDVRWRLAGGKPRGMRLGLDLEGGSLRSTGLGGVAVLPVGDQLLVGTDRRAMPFSLELRSKSSEPESLHLERSLRIGDSWLPTSWLPRLPSGERLDWPEEEPEPLVDLVRDAGLYTRIVVPGEKGRAVELLLTLYPPARQANDRSGQPRLDCVGSGLERLPFTGRGDALRVRATTPLDLQVEEPPGHDLALAVRIEGKWVSVRRIRRDGKRFAAPGSLALYVPDWLPGVTEGLGLEPLEELSGGFMRLSRTGPQAPTRRAPSEDERALLQRLGPGE
ncbi:MAG: arylsulfatase A-like enzyme [Planctomycetota bacterium]|jgi:arylsulfatase A-like enzyme